MLLTKENSAKFALPALAAFSLLPFVSSGVALLLGVALAVTLGNPYQARTKVLASSLLSWSVMGLGAGMNLGVIGRVGLAGVGYTMSGILLAFVVGTLIGRLLRTEKDTSLLLTVGTAICGGSAIAAVAPVIRAKSHEVSVALGVVFLLNALALFLFPSVGHYFELTQKQFGLWAALAIHDTSSVVGASMQYGALALETGTTVKLARAIWIIPVALIIAQWRARQKATLSDGVKAKRPWFILGFLAAAAIVTWIPELQPAGHVVETIAKKLLVVTLFLIGSNLTLDTLKKVGARPLLQAVLLWAVVATVSLTAIKMGWIA